MNYEQIIVWVLVAVASVYVGRVLWKEIRGLLWPSEAGDCSSCSGCDNKTHENDPMLPKVTPLVRLQTGPRPTESVDPGKSPRE